jgi:DNA-binding NtrC family response regulator
MRILVIDDDVTMLWSLSGILRQWGSEVSVATGAGAGLRMLERSAFDVILLDYRMPDHDGLWFLRNAGLSRETAVVLMSGFVDPVAMSQLRCMGINDVLEKPFSQSDLLELLQKLSVESTWRHDAERQQAERGRQNGIERGAHRVDEKNGWPRPLGEAAPHAA